MPRSTPRPSELLSLLSCSDVVAVVRHRALRGLVWCELHDVGVTQHLVRYDLDAQARCFIVRFQEPRARFGLGGGVLLHPRVLTPHVPSFSAWATFLRRCWPRLVRCMRNTLRSSRRGSLSTSLSPSSLLRWMGPRS